MTITEAARYLRCNPKVLSRWVQAGRVRHGRAGRDLRFRQEWLDHFVESSNVESPICPPP
jgi:excisionase family DNA binding protein